MDYGSDPRITVDYLPSGHSWPGDAVHLSNSEGLQLLCLHISFLKGSGQGTWKHVYEILRLVADVQEGTRIYRDGEAVQPTTDAPEQGKYVVRGDSEDVRIVGEGYISDVGAQAAPGLPVLPARGPENPRSRFLPAPSLVSEDESPDESEDSPMNQGERRLRDRLLVRDGFCLVTDTSEELCEATYIVPPSRRDVYEDVLGPYGHQRMYNPSSAILLNANLSRPFGLYALSLWPAEDGTYIVHVFSGPADLRKHHGRRIDPRTRMQPLVPRKDWPEPRLLKWHYKQCAMVHLRGYAWDMAVDARGGRV